MDESELAKYPGLKRRDDSGVWYVRKRVPLDLRHVEPRESVRVSLETTDKRTALRLYPAAMAEIVRGFEQKRADLGRQDKVTQALLTAKLEKLSRVEIDGLVWSWWEKRAALRHPDIDPFERGETLQAIEEELENLTARFAEPSAVIAPVPCGAPDFVQDLPGDQGDERSHEGSLSWTISSNRA